jgi:hypothetical protein
MPPTPDNQPYSGGGGAPSSTSAGGSKPDDFPLPPYGPSASTKLVNRRGGAGGDDGAGGVSGKMDRRLSTARVPAPSKSLLLRSQTGDFDHNRWLFETKGTYGIGNAYWPQDNNAYADDDGGGAGGGPVKMEDLVDKPWKPLSRKVAIPPGILSPYRFNSRRPEDLTDRPMLPVCSWHLATRQVIDFDLHVAGCWCWCASSRCSCS